MKRTMNHLPRLITTIVLIAVMIVGMTAPMGHKAQAAPGTYTLKFSNNGISGVSNLPKDVATSPQYPTVTIPSQIPTRANYTFAGYDTSSAAKTVRYKAGSSIKLTAAITTLYPVWTGGPSTYTLSFSANGVSGVSNLPNPISTDPRYAITIPTKTPTRPNYSFAGYDTSYKATTVRYKAGSNIKITKNTTLYPVWTPKNYYVYFYINSTTCTSRRVPYGSYITSITDIPKPARGYSRIWYFTADPYATTQKKTNKQLSSSSKVTGDVALICEDSPLTCTAHFYKSDSYSELLFAKTLKTGRTFLQSAAVAPYVNGSTFVGWKKKGDSRDIIYAEGDIYYVESSGTQSFAAVYLSTSRKSQEYTILMSKEMLISILNQVTKEHNDLVNKYASSYANRALLEGISGGLECSGTMIAASGAGVLVGTVLVVAGFLVGKIIGKTSKADAIKAELDKLEERYNLINNALGRGYNQYYVNASATHGESGKIVFTITSIETTGIK